MVLDLNPFTISLIVQSILLGISQLDFVSEPVSKVIVIGLIVVNSFVALAFKSTDAGKALALRAFTKPGYPAQMTSEKLKHG